MLSRLRLSSKMVLAAAPLVAVLLGLLALTVGTNVDQIAEADRTGNLGATWIPLVDAIEAVDSEQDIIVLNDVDETQRARQATDNAFASLNDAVSGVPDAGATRVTVADAMSSLGRARATEDSGEGGSLVGVFAEYGTTQETLVNLGDLLATEATDPELGRKLQAVAALTRAVYNTDQMLEMVDLTITSGRPINIDRAELLSRNALFALERFEASAPADWAEIYQRRNLPATTEASIAELDWLLERGPDVSAEDAAQFDMPRFSAPLISETGLRNLLAERVTSDAAELSSGIAQQTYIRIGYVSAAILAALVLSFLTSRSITRRMGRVSERARQVATEQLPTLVQSLRDPNGSTPLPVVTPIEGVGTDEIGELAESFTAVQSTLVDVATEQMDVLRRGVSDIFVTLARRNRSLVDRQLALLDELEANVEDPELLSNYYKLDHMATRMRRSAESLLVLANSDTQRRRSGPIEIDDVIRAAISEVEDYRRVEVLALEGLQIKGPLVADTSHLLAELLDNAAAFSPPDSRVSVAGHFTGTGYLITISDRGVGIPGQRLQQLNDLLTKPPVIGLSVEPTLGLSVVSLLAAKHGIKVGLVQAAPGISVNVVIPSTMYQHTTDLSDEPGFDEAFDAVFNEVVHPQDPGPAPDQVMPEVASAPAPTAEDDAVRATSSALDAIAALNREQQDTTTPDRTSAERTEPVAESPVTTSDLPQRRPAVIDPDPAQPVSDFRPAPSTETPPIAPLETTPLMPAPTAGEMRVPNLAPPPAPAPVREPEPAAPSLAASGLPIRSPGSAEPMTDAGLPRREGGSGPEAPTDARPVAASNHDPEALRSTLSAFHTSTQLGRLEGADATDIPNDTPILGGRD
jgi:signal transduction histidine kinase